MIKYWSVCFFLLSVSAGAQTSFSDRLQGKVLHDTKSIADVHVMNTTSRKATITDEDGNFSLPVKLGDTLVFSAVQFKRKTMVVTITILESASVFVPLEEFVNELDEVVLRPFDLSGDLTRDMENLNTEAVVTASTLGLPNAYAKPLTQSERLLREASGGSVVLGAGIAPGAVAPLNPIINAITGRTKMLKKRVVRDTKYARTERVRHFYADSLFVRELKIPQNKIDDFMYFCEVDPAFSSIVDTHDRLKIWTFIRKKSTIYRKNNNLK